MHYLNKPRLAQTTLFMSLKSVTDMLNSHFREGQDCITHHSLPGTCKLASDFT